jgi:hypothetical protein
MQIRAFRYSLCLAALSFFACTGLAGQTNGTGDGQPSLQAQIAHLQKEIKDANDRHAAELKKLQEEVELLKEEPRQPGEFVAAPQANPGEAQASRRNRQSFNPDISAIGDVLFHSGKNEEGENESQFQLRELELAFGAAVDPYGRADFFIGIHQEGSEWHTHVEEGYFTFDTLPYDLKARVGQFYSAFGKANQYHTHSMPWVDKPLVIHNYFGEEGMSEAGAELSWLVPNPWDSYIELTGELQSNRNPLSFAGDDGRELMYVTHLKNFFDLGSDASLELGGSFAGGKNAATEDGHWTNLEGVDVTYKWRPAQQGLYRSLTWMSELLLSQKDQGAEDTVDSYGLYSSLEYQFSRRWSTFGRYDYSQFPDDDDSHENALNAGLTFAQSEYCFWRVQFTHADGEGISAPSSRNELFLQLDFGIGPHRAHQY